MVLKLRPVGGVEAVNAHPGMAVLQEAGVCHEGVLDHAGMIVALQS